jgi:hypothetical protein
MTYPERGTEYHHLLYASPLRSTKELDRRLEGAVRQEIYLEPIGHDVLFGASMPLAFAFESKVGVRSPRKERNDEIRLSHSAGIKYEVYSQVQPPAPERLRGAPDRVPQTYQHYLQLPPEITQRTRDLAREITRDARTNYDKAVAIETWLRKNLRYTLQMRSPGDQEPIDFFLFERQRGHCEYFSSAMAILSRAVGVPTRNVNGFLGGEWNEYNDYIAVRAGDAHSWVEVYFYGVGWVTFDPTPPAQVDRLGRGSGGVRAKLARFVDTLRFKWFKWVIEYDLYRQFSLFRKIGSSLRGGASSVKSLMGGVKRTLVDHRRGLFSAIVAGLLLALVITVLRRRRGGPIAFRRAARRAPIAALYASIAQRLARCGHSRPRSMTPREYAARLERLAVPGAADMTRLTDLYYAAVYSGAPDDADMVEAERLRAAIGEALRGYKAPRKGAKSSKAAKDEATDSTAAEPTAAESAVAEAADRGAQETDK